MKEIAKQYDPKQVEDRLYKHWMEKGYFHAEVDENKKPFCIVMPPPNITGQLHMGHALDNMMQDAIIRFKRMQGFSALWLPGTDHASIATEVKIVDAMAKEGLKKEDLGREKFLERAWDWKKQYGGRIIEQLKKMGSSCDWDRERFTLDDLAKSTENYGTTVADTFEATQDAPDKLKAGLNELKLSAAGIVESIFSGDGEKLQSQLSKLTVKIVEKIQSIVPKIVAIVPKIITAILKAIPNVISMIATIVSKVAATLGELLPEVVKEIIGIIPTIALALSNAIPMLLPPRRTMTA